MTDLPPEDICHYACEDADVTFTLKKILDKELKKLKLSSLFYDVEQPLMRVLCEIENNGVKIDVDFLSSMSNQLTKLIEETEQKFSQ